MMQDPNRNKDKVFSPNETIRDVHNELYDLNGKIRKISELSHFDHLTDDQRFQFRMDLYRLVADFTYHVVSHDYGIQDYFYSLFPEYKNQ